MSVRQQAHEVVGGVDTHKDSDAVVALDSMGQWLGGAQFPTTPPGYSDLLKWLRAHGTLLCVGVEATGSYGAGLARYLVAQQVSVLEVIPPRRRSRRGRNKSDSADAEAAGISGSTYEVGETFPNFDGTDQFGNKVELYQFYGAAVLVDCHAMRPPFEIERFTRGWVVSGKPQRNRVVGCRCGSHVVSG